MLLCSRRSQRGLAPCTLAFDSKTTLVGYLGLPWVSAAVATAVRSAMHPGRPIWLWDKCSSCIADLAGAAMYLATASAPASCKRLECSFKTCSGAAKSCRQSIRRAHPESPIALNEKSTTWSIPTLWSSLSNNLRGKADWAQSHHSWTRSSFMCCRVPNTLRARPFPRTVRSHAIRVGGAKTTESAVSLLLSAGSSMGSLH
mmetsp:Transcript_1802/g.4999  ORF Transcript_1802/g.4999 Transcript_1802/m.4999 type:complete len:201 (+) Transcript_1802:952-1554(+)